MMQGVNGSADQQEQMFFDPGVITSLATSELPSIEEFPGIYNFDMDIGQQGTESKRQAWQYSMLLKKAFIIEGRNLPLHFKISPEAPPGLYIRAVAVYTDPDSYMKPVLRCPNHRQSLGDPINKDYAYVDHVVSCNNQMAVYEVDSKSQRHSVAVRLSGAQPGSSWETIMFAMMCRSSCLNGINRRPIALVFTLEMYCQVLGRRVLPLRVCASPYRDKTLEENKLIKEENSLKYTPTIPQELGPLDSIHYVPVTNIDDYETLVRYAHDLVAAEFPPGELRDGEIDKYNNILVNLSGQLAYNNFTNYNNNF